MSAVTAAFLLAIFCFAGQARSAQSAAASIGEVVDPLPHIVFVVADDLGFHDLGFRGTRIKTPNLDSLALGGVVLEQYYVQPVCTPSRASFMTGRYPFRYGLQHYVMQGGHDYGLFLNETLIPEKLKGAGYMNHAVGKWHLGMCSWKHTPTFRGFDSYFGFYGGGEDYYTHKHGGYDMRRDKQPNCGEGCSEVAWDAQGHYSTHLFAGEAVGIIQEHDVTKPLFLYAPFQAVHAPDEVPESYIEPYNTTIPDKKRRTFAGMLSALDEGVGNITKALMQKDMWNNTVFVFSTDNGGPIAGSSRCHICGDNTGTNNYPLRGGKHTLWEGGVRGTAFVHSKRISKPGTKRYGLMHAVDWFPTFLELARLDPDHPPTFPLDGVSQWTMISEGVNSSRSEIVLNIDSLHNTLGPKREGGGGDAAFRQGDWKLTVGDPGPPDIWSANPTNSSEHVPDAVQAAKTHNFKMMVGAANKTVQLFNIASDEREMHNVAEQNPSVVTAMLSKLMQYAEEKVPPLFSFGPADPKSNVKNFNDTWTPWTDDC
ncbi:arylsulfatase B-like [Sycon ciliatum]|uniref:arylsulfatase B-like n=1 Tax=Sycon ciliatum TaxID=27933 RepID=UPI0031F6F1DC